jgi:hypothetical protein
MTALTLIETILTKEFVVLKLANDEDYEEADEVAHVRGEV